MKADEHKIAYIQKCCNDSLSVFMSTTTVICITFQVEFRCKREPRYENLFREDHFDTYFDRMEHTPFEKL